MKRWFKKRTKPEPCEAHGLIIKDSLWRTQHAILDNIEAQIRNEENPPSDEDKQAMMALLVGMGPIRGSFGDRNSYGPGPCGHLGPYPGCPKCWSWT